jgi:hypothetical protein
MWIGLGLALGVVLEFLPKPRHNVFWGVVYNTGHAPLFGVGSLVLLQLSKLLLAERVGRYRNHYVIAFAGCAALGFASELWQFFDAGRDADLLDIARDMLGAAVFLAFAATFDKRSRDEMRWFANHPRTVRVIAIVALLANFVPIVAVELAYRHRDDRFPVLASFDSYWDTWFYSAHHGATGERVAPPAGWTGHDGSDALAVTFGGTRGPRLEMLEPSPDWTGYHRLSVDIFSSHDDEVQLVVRARDRLFRNNPANRYQRSFTISPGANRLEIDIADIRVGPTERELNIATMRKIVFLVDAAPEPIRLFFDNLRLE